MHGLAQVCYTFLVFSVSPHSMVYIAAVHGYRVSRSAGMAPGRAAGGSFQKNACVFLDTARKKAKNDEIICVGIRS